MKGQIHGVCRQGGRGIPSHMKQEADSKQNIEFKARNKLMVLVCKGDPYITDIVCTSLYETKPFYMMSIVANQVTWTNKFMNVFCENLQRKVEVPFYRLSLADEYNNKMGNVDLGDQLCNYYRFDHFIRKIKSWWSFWMWAVEVCLTNSYVLYKTYCKLHKIVLKYTHYEWVCQIGKAWFHPEE